MVVGLARVEQGITLDCTFLFRFILLLYVSITLQMQDK